MGYMIKMEAFNDNRAHNHLHGQTCQVCELQHLVHVSVLCKHTCADVALQAIHSLQKPLGAVATKSCKWHATSARHDTFGFLHDAHNVAAHLHCCHKGRESHAYLAERLQDTAAVALVCQSDQASTHSSTVVASKQSKPILTCGYDTRNMAGSNSHAPVC